MKDNITQPFKWQYYALGLFLVFLFCVQAFYIQSSMILNADVSFLSQIALYAEGRDFYLQFYEINPPLIVYIYKFIFFINESSNINYISALRLGMICYLFICSSIILYNISHFKYGTLISITISFCFLFTFPNDFLQREHIITAAIFTYASSAINRILGVETPRRVKVINSFFIFIAISLKPQYFIVFSFSELYISYHSKKINNIYSLEVILSAILGGLYLFYVHTYHQSYFNLIVPLASTSYSAYFIPSEDIVILIMVLLLFTFLPIRYLYTTCKGNTYSPIINYTIILYLSSIITFSVGRTGFSYHLLLGANLSLLFIFLSIYTSTLEVVNKKSYRDLIQLSLSILILLTLHEKGYYNLIPYGINTSSNSAYDSNNTIFDYRDSKSHDIKDLYFSLNKNSNKNEKIFALTTTLYPIHTVVAHNNLEWVNKFPVMWPLPNHLTKINDDSDGVIYFVKNSIKNDLIENRPNLIIIETSDYLRRYPDNFSFLNFINSDKTIHTYLKSYKVVDIVSYKDMEFTILKREESKYDK